MENCQTTNMLKLARYFFFFNAAVWLIFGTSGFTQVTASMRDWRLILSVLMIANAIVVIWFFVFIGVTIPHQTRDESGR